MESKRNYLDPLILTKISNMFLRARFVVEGFIAGLHQSPFRGFSLQFAQHREYAPGDELKHLDWKVYGKTDRYCVKQYQEETNLKAYIILDCSASMGYGSSSNLSKFQYGSYLTASLAYLMLRQQDSVGLVTFDEIIKDYIPPRSNRAHLSMILGKLESLLPSGKTKISAVLKKMEQYIKRRGLIILISDFFDEQEEVLKSLKYFHFKKHEIIVFHLLDDSELEFPFEGLVLFEDIEKGTKVLTYPEVIKKRYEDSINHFVESYKLKCRENGIDYCFIRTSTPLDYALGIYLVKRQKLIR